MTYYYILLKKEYIDHVLEELCHLPSEMVTSIVINDNTGFMPPKYIRVSTDYFTDVGLVDALKKNTTIFNPDKKVKILKELQAYVPLV